MRKAAGIIPARWGSTRFPGKPLYLIAGKPLLRHVWERCRRAKKLDSVIIATDDLRIENAAEASSPHQVKVVLDLKGRALYFSRTAIPYPHNVSQIKYLRHQGIYGFRRETLLQFVKWKPTLLERAESLEQLRALENGVSVHVLVTKDGSPGVDTPEDAIALERKLACSKRSALS